MSSQLPYLQIYYNISFQEVKKPKNTITYIVNSNVVNFGKKSCSPTKLTLPETYNPMTAESNIKNITGDLNYSLMIGDLSQKMSELGVDVVEDLLLEFANNNWALISEILLNALNQISFNVYMSKLK